MSYYRTYKIPVNKASSSDRIAKLKSKTIYSECVNRANNGGIYNKITPSGKPNGSYIGNIYISPESNCLVGARSYEDLLTVSKGKYLTTPPQTPLENNTFDLWYGQFSITDYSNPNTPAIIVPFQGSNNYNQLIYDCSYIDSCTLVDFSNNLQNAHLVIDPSSSVFYDSSTGPTNNCYAKNERAYLQYVDISNNSNMAHNYQRFNELQGFTYHAKIQFNCENASFAPWNYDSYVPNNAFYIIKYGFVNNNVRSVPVPTALFFTIGHNSYDYFYIERNKNNAYIKVFVYNENYEKLFITFTGEETITQNNLTLNVNDALLFEYQQDESNSSQFYILYENYYLLINNGVMQLTENEATGTISSYYLNSENNSPIPEPAPAPTPASITVVFTFINGNQTNSNDITITKESYSYQNDVNDISKIEIKQDARIIGDYAFDGAENLISLSFDPNSQLASIGALAFNDAIILPSIVIPASVASIGTKAFYGTYKLTSITVDGNNKNYKDISGVLFDKDGKTLIKYPEAKNNITDYTIPTSVITIEESAFSFVIALKSITIPEYVSNIGAYAFFSMNNLSAITVNGNNKYYKDISGVLFDKDGTDLIKYPEEKSLINYTIPASVVNIEAKAFIYTKKLKIITFELNSGLKSIGKEAFFGMNDLNSITIPSSVSSIDKTAFGSCFALKTVFISDIDEFNKNNNTSFSYDTNINDFYGATNIIIKDPTPEDILPPQTTLPNVVNNPPQLNVPV